MPVFLSAIGKTSEEKCIWASRCVHTKWNINESEMFWNSIFCLSRQVVLSLLVFMNIFQCLIFFCLLSHQHITQYTATNSNLAGNTWSVEYMEYLLGFGFPDWRQTLLKMDKFQIKPFTDPIDASEVDMTVEIWIFPSSGQSLIAAQSPSTLSSLLICKIQVSFASTATSEPVKALYLK